MKKTLAGALVGILAFAGFAVWSNMIDVRFPWQVLPEFADRKEARELNKAEVLAPFIEAALARKERMPELADDEIPVVGASVKKAELYK